MTTRTLLPIVSALRATSLFSDTETVTLEVILCDRTKNGDEVPAVDFATWTGLVARALCEIAGGCSSTPGTGYWVRRTDGQLLRDDTVTLRAVAPRSTLLANITRLRSVLVQYGRECEQEAVAISLNGELYLIDPAKAY